MIETGKSFPPRLPTAGCRVVQVAGELDLATSGQLQAALERGRVAGTAVVADLADVGFCDASGLNTLLAANARGREQHAPLRIVPSRAVRLLVHLAGAAAVLSLYPDRRRALAHRGGRSPSRACRTGKRHRLLATRPARTAAWRARAPEPARVRGFGSAAGAGAVGRVGVVAAAGADAGV